MAQASSTPQDSAMEDFSSLARNYGIDLNADDANGGLGSTSSGFGGGGLSSGGMERNSSSSLDALFPLLLSK